MNNFMPCDTISIIPRVPEKPPGDVPRLSGLGGLDWIVNAITKFDNDGVLCSSTEEMVASLEAVNSDPEARNISLLSTGVSRMENHIYSFTGEFRKQIQSKGYLVKRSQQEPRLYNDRHSNKHSNNF